MKPLIVRFGALGDMILTTGLMRALADRHGEPCDVVTVAGPARTALQHLPFVGEIITVSSRKTPYLFCPEQWRLVEKLRATRHEPIYVLQSDAKSLRLIRRAGHPIANDMIACPRGANEHVVDHYVRIAGISDESARAPELRVSADEEADVAAWLKKIGCDAPPVLIQPGNKRTMRGKIREDAKYWPSEHWLAVIRAARIRLPQAHVLIIGSPGEQEMTDSLAAAANDPRVRSVAGDLPLRRLFALLKRAHSLISVDTGPAHAAAALGCPLAVLFGKADPRAIRPVSAGSPVAVVTAKPVSDAGTTPWADYHDMRAIAPDQAIAAWKSL